MSDRNAPNGGVTITVPAGDRLLDRVVDEADRVTDVLADAVAVLRSDPVDLVALRRVVDELAAHAQYLADELDSVVP
jgi:hypothetical protein